MKAVRLLLLASLLISFCSGTAHAGVSAEGLITSDRGALVVNSPLGGYTLALTPTRAEHGLMQSRLEIREEGEESRFIPGVRGNAFFISDLERIVAIEVPDTTAVPGRLEVLDFHGRRLLVRELLPVSDPALSSDGSSLVFRSNREIHLLDLRTFEERVYPNLAIFAAGPDGRLAGAPNGGAAEVFIHTGHTVRHTVRIDSRPRRIAWWPDGSVLFVLTAETLYRLPRDAGSPSVVFSAPPDSELRDLRVTGKTLQVGIRHLDEEGVSGELLTLGETMAPVFEPAQGSSPFAFCDNETDNYQDPATLTGQVDIIAHVGDRIDSTWVCAVQSIVYSIYPVGNPKAAVVSDKLAVDFDMDLDTYQSGPVDPFLVDLLYKQDAVCQTYGDYDYREFYHIITNSDGDQVYEASDLLEAWDTTTVWDGDYVVEVTATDAAGNSTVQSMVVTTVNGLIPTDTVAASLSCLPGSGTVPFVTTMTATLENLYEEQSRTLAGRLAVDLAGGQHFDNWRAGYTNVAPEASFTTNWNQSIPALGTLIGVNTFTLAVEDVTPAPYNQPPYAPAGDTDEAACTVTAAAP